MSNIKRAWDFTQEELLALEPADILRLRDMECMCEGAPLLPKPPGGEPHKPNVVGEQVAHHVNAEMLFFNEADAREVLELIRSKARADEYYLGGNWQGPRGVKPEDPNQGSMEAKRFWTPEQFATHKLVQETYQTAKSKWEAEDKEYREAQKDRETAVQRVDSRLEDAYEKQRRAQSIRDTWAQYLELANGNQGIALGFLLKLGRWDQKVVLDVLGMDLTVAAEMTPDHGTVVVDVPPTSNPSEMPF